ncbi:MAG TPA: glycosyltransferase family 2 protein [Opitutaceae bacterium]|nr:glycosyltransferase family 2 protein [Opitutaceae bacterium]HWB98895.1 glycosyltransferase family 2 protein [Bryobacteraceae bacterium]
MKESLAIIMPVYNEEGAIAGVLAQWVAMLDGLADLSYQIHVYNDGSKDGTARILGEVGATFAGRVVVHNKANSGHGPTILLGYRENAPGFDWLFQIDSDGEIGPEKFPDVWNRRREHDFLIGRRQNRYSPLPRKIISAISRLTVRCLYGSGVCDVNCPFRLMRSSVVGPFLKAIPADTFAPNVILSGLACRQRWRIYEVPVLFLERQTGEVSIRKWKLLKAAARSFRQTVAFARKAG